MNTILTLELELDLTRPGEQFWETRRTSEAPMPRCKTPSFVLTLKLNTSERDAHVLHDRFFAAFLMTNALVKHARKRLAGLRQDRRYRALMEERRPLVGKTDRVSKHRLARINEALKALRLEYGLSEYQFHAWIKEQQHRYRSRVDSDTAQKQVTRVWRAVEGVLFRKGKTIHFKRFDDLASLEGKSAHSPMRMKDGRLHWSGLVIQPRIRKDDAYARAALRGRVKYCRVVRKPMRLRDHYYLQLVIEGRPPAKHPFLPDGRVGLDQGTSTEAIVSEDGKCLLAALPDKTSSEKELRRIRRRMDRSKRASNPDNYLPDGRVKPHPHRFVKTKRYRRDRMRMKALCRKQADASRQYAECLANTILCEYGSDVITERMNYRALQRKAKEASVNPDTGTFRSRKRFGKSLLHHAPARFRTTLNRKLAYIGKEVFLVDTFAYRASQFHHDTGEYIPPGLQNRAKRICGAEVQRDLYSAFLLMCAADETVPDTAACERIFPAFLAGMEAELARLLKEEKNHPSSMGLEHFRRLMTA